MRTTGTLQEAARVQYTGVNAKIRYKKKPQPTTNYFCAWVTLTVGGLTINDHQVIIYKLARKRGAKKTMWEGQEKHTPKFKGILNV